MSQNKLPPSTFLWVIRSLVTAFLLGYLGSIYIAILVAESWPSGILAEDLLGGAFLIVFASGYYLMWIRRELLAGIVFIFWYAALWPAELFIGGDSFKDAPLPGILILILGILLLVYRSGVRRRNGLNAGISE